MLQIGCPKAKVLNEKLNHLDYEGIHFEVVECMGLTLKVKHNAENDAQAKAAVKKYITELSEFKNAYTNIQLIDENGRIL